MRLRLRPHSSLMILGALAAFLVASPSTIASGDIGPVCDTGGPYLVECNGPVTSVQLDGTGSIFDGGKGDVLITWETTCAEAFFDDTHSLTPILFVPFVPFDFGDCQVTCDMVRLTIHDGEFTSTCTTTVTVQDTTSPSITVPGDTLLLWDGISAGDPAHAGSATSQDSCDPAPFVSYSDSVQYGMPPTGIEAIITRTWSAVDACGNPVMGTPQIITLVGESYFEGDNQMPLDIMPTQCPNVIRVSEAGTFTVTLLGSDGFNARTVNPRRLGIFLGSGVGGVVTPFRAWMRDVGTPIANGSCLTLGADGHADVVMRFRVQDVVQAFGLDSLSDGATIDLRAGAKTFDGRLVFGIDRIQISNP